MAFLIIQLLLAPGLSPALSRGQAPGKSSEAGTARTGIAGAVPDSSSPTTGTDNTAAINNALRAGANNGSGRTIWLSADPLGKGRCYLISGPLALQARQVLEGDGCIQVKAGTQVPGILVGGVPDVILRDLELKGDAASTPIGIRIAGTQNNVTGAKLENIKVSGFVKAGISLSESYDIALDSIKSTNNYDGLRLEDDTTALTPCSGTCFNDTIRIFGGDYSLNTHTGISVGRFSAQVTVASAVIESNYGCGIQFGSPVFEPLLTGNHFENNNLHGAGQADVCFAEHGAIARYDQPSQNPVIVANDFNERGTDRAILMQYVASPLIADNHGAYDSGPGSRRDPVILLGPVVSDPDIRGNTGFRVVNESAQSILSGEQASSLSENQFLYSVSMNNAAWHIDAGSLSQDRTEGPAGGWAWKLTFGPNAAKSRPAFAGQSVPFPRGHLAGECIWARADTGSVTGSPFVTGSSGNYSGSVLNQPYARTVGSAWERVCQVLSFPVTDAGSLVGLGWFFYPSSGSGATAVYLSAPFAWLDIAGIPGYVPTTSERVGLGPSGAIGHTVFSQLGPARGSPIICDDCTQASPVRGGGDGTLVFPLAGAWTGLSHQ